MSKAGASWRWFAIVAVTSLLFVLARAARWTEGVTLDDTFTLLLGALPFIGFYLFNAFIARETIPFRLPIMAWIFTLVIFLVIRLTPIVYDLEGQLGSANWNENYARMLYSAAYAFAGTALASLLCSRQVTWTVWTAAYLAIIWGGLAIYLWLFVYFVPPNISFG